MNRSAIKLNMKKWSFSALCDPFFIASVTEDNVALHRLMKQHNEGTSTRIIGCAILVITVIIIIVATFLVARLLLKG